MRESDEDVPSKDRANTSEAGERRSSFPRGDVQVVEVNSFVEPVQVGCLPLLVNQMLYPRRHDH